MVYLRHRLSSYHRQYVLRSIASVRASSSSNGKPTLVPEATTGSGEEQPKYKPGWFSRNPGVTLGGILLGIGLYIYRGSRGRKNFEAQQKPILEAAVISPYEAWELRSSNNITPEIFENVRDGVTKAFPSGKATMQHFDQYLGFKLASGLNKAYHLERVLLNLETSVDHKSDVDAQMIAFSMAVKGSVDERLRLLFNLATSAPAGEALNVNDDKGETREITRQQFERLLHLLLETYQIPSEKRVLPVKDMKYPFQEFTVATPSDLLQEAIEAAVANKLIAEESCSYTFDTFAQLMRGNVVCVWGECFSNSKKKMKN